MSRRARLPLDGKYHSKVCNISGADLLVSYTVIMVLYIASCINDRIFYTRSFYACHQEQMTPSPIDYTFVDLALSNVSIKDNSDQPSQTSYEDEASKSDGLVTATTSTPIPTSLSSKTSCSSGYHSAGSYVDESISLKSIQPSFPESTGEVLSLHSHKRNTSNTRTLQIDGSMHKSIFAKPKSTHSSALPHLSTGQESTLTMPNWLVFSYNCIPVYIDG